MNFRWVFRALILAALLFPVSLVSEGHAQEPELGVEIEPQGGPPGTEVTITGQGAPPNEEVRVLYAYWQDEIPCRIGRDAEVVADVTADSQGNFSATHVAARIDAEQVGYTYLAEHRNSGALSNLQCFAFDDVSESRYFPQTDQWMTARFLEYWNQHGGLPVFGYPLTDDVVEDGRTVQYTERQRFELHSELNAPYDVLLGRLGNTVAEQRGLLETEPFQPLSSETGSNQNCTFYEQTGHRLCHGFRDYWENNGLEFGDAGVSHRESLALFGYPISEEYTDEETGLTVQYFERARFEFHPENDPPYDVLLGRLGAEMDR